PRARRHGPLRLVAAPHGPRRLRPGLLRANRRRRAVLAPRRHRLDVPLPAPLPHMTDAPHPVRASVLVRTAATLLALTALTVAASRLDLGRFGVVLALAIAVLKATIVALFFMH